MKPSVVLLAPLLLAMPLALPVAAAGSAHELPAVTALSPIPLAHGAAAEDAHRAPIAEQVRIEQRVTIRIAPRMVLATPLVSTPEEDAAPRFDERKMGKCVAVGGIAGVQIGGDDKLMLFMRDQRIVSATLEKACSARDFYSGFYIERSADGMLCVDRDTLQSRTGANCSLRRLRQLVERE